MTRIHKEAGKNGFFKQRAQRAPGPEGSQLQHERACLSQRRFKAVIGPTGDTDCTLSHRIVQKILRVVSPPTTRAACVPSPAERCSWRLDDCGRLEEARALQDTHPQGPRPSPPHQRLLDGLSPPPAQFFRDEARCSDHLKRDVSHRTAMDLCG